MTRQATHTFIFRHLGRYLTANEAGLFGSDAESKGKNELFEIEAQEDGKWALKSAFGFYAGGTGEALDAFTKVLDADRLWTVQLAMHPQICMKNVNRKRYVHLAGDCLDTTEDVPWGDDAMITLKFFDEGKYALETCDGRFLSESGALKNEPTADCRFIIQFFGTEVAFKGSNGLYVSAVGGNGVLKASKKTVGKDEQFDLEDSHPQVKLLAWNGKRVSIKTGVEVNASQDVVEDTEFFQMEINKQTKMWSLRTCKDLCWSMREDGTIINDFKGERTRNEWFDIVWQGAKISLRGANGKYVETKKNGALAAIAPEINEHSTYIYEIINRPKLVLRGEHGFVGTMPSCLLECNKSTAEVYNMRIIKGVCQISGSNGKFWKVGSNGVTCTGAEPDDFYIELLEHSKMVIKCGQFYLQGSQNGAFTATGTVADASTLWEY